MKVLDLFCGAGGFSEGFSQAGFDISHAFDNWGPAIITHQQNHPFSMTQKYDIEKLSRLPDDEFHKLVPDTEIIIGSPPCVAFSNSNFSGNGDKTHGIKLLEAFFRIVFRKTYYEKSILKYWIFENVPNSQQLISETYS